MNLRKFLVMGLAIMMFANSIFAQGGNFNSKSGSAVMTAPQYQIFDIGVVQTGDSASQGFRVSPGGVAVGRSVRNNGAQAYTWTSGGGITGLPNLSSRAFCVSNAANDGGAVAGSCANSLSGLSRLPVIWRGGVVSQLPLPAGETLGDANGVNSSGIAVGSVNSSVFQRGVIYSSGSASVITQTTSGGSYFVTAFTINDSGRIVGQGIDPNNAARNVGIVYDMGSSSAFEVGALPGANGALAFGVSNNGYVVGTSMMNQGSGMPFIWSQAGGMVAIPLVAGTSQGSARAVNSAGWAVGTDGGQFAVPFLYDGTASYRLADLIPAGSGWDLSTNTSSSALGISESKVIVGTGVYNGQIHAYAMVPQAAATNKTSMDFDGDGKSDLSVFRPSDRIWYLNNSTAGFAAVQFGLSDDKLVPADYDGDGKTDVAIWRESERNFYILNSSNNSVRVENFGLTGDVPTVGDYDGDGKADLSTYREGAQSYFFYRASANNPGGSITYLALGTNGDKPQRGDFDGDGKADLAVFRPSNAVWYIFQSSNSSVRYDNWGLASDKFVPADYDGDGKTDLAVFRGGVWYIKQSSTNQPRYETFGFSTDKLVPADYDGDGKADVAVYRDGIWYLQQSASGFAASSFGNSTDKPAAEAF